MLVQVACPKDENKTNKHNKQKKGGGNCGPKINTQNVQIQDKKLRCRVYIVYIVDPTNGIVAQVSCQTTFQSMAMNVLKHKAEHKHKHI